MSKREYIQANMGSLMIKSKEEGVKALPKGIYYKVLVEGNASSAKLTVRQIRVKEVDGEIVITNLHVGSLCV